MWSEEATMAKRLAIGLFQSLTNSDWQSLLHSRQCNHCQQAFTYVSSDVEATDASSLVYLSYLNSVQIFTLLVSKSFRLIL